MLRIALTAAALLCAPAAAAAMNPGEAPKAAPAAVAEGAVGAGGSAEVAPAAAAKAAKPAKKLICRREDGTGARTAAAKVCLTKEQWKAIDREG